MSAGGTLQSAIATALNALPDLTGVYDGPPARAAYPYVALDATTESDWSHKSGAGREVMVAITVWDDQPVRLHGLADQVETALSDLGAVDGWQLVTMQLVRRRVVRDVAGVLRIPLREEWPLEPQQAGGRRIPGAPLITKEAAKPRLELQLSVPEYPE